AVAQSAIANEAKALVVRRVAQHNATLCTSRPKLLQALADQCRASPAPLIYGFNRNRSQPEPAARLTVDRDWRECCMADDLALLLGNQRKSQRTSLAQRVNDGRFGSAAMRRIFERGNDDGSDRGSVFITLMAYDHDWTVALGIVDVCP